MIIIKRKDFLLRSPLKKDAKILWNNYNDKDIAKNMVTMETEKKFKKEWVNSFKKVNKNINLILVIECDKNPVGLISVRTTDEFNKTKVTMSFWIGKKYRNKGITTKTIKLFTKYVFKKFKIVRIQANVRTFNKASAKVLEKSGYKLEGIKRKNILKNRKFYDDYIYARIK